MTVLGLLALSACIPFTHFPLSDKEKVEKDPRLPGAWVHRFDGGETILHFSNYPKGQAQEMVYVEFRDSGGLSFLASRVFSAKVGAESFLNIELTYRFEIKENEIPIHMLASYRFDEDMKLYIKPWTLEEIVQGLQEEKFSGTLIEKQDKYLIVQDSQGHKMKFFNPEDEKKLAKWTGPFKKIMTPKVLIVE
ncbi:hypothetical protein NITGR_170120 [Nitrospina gracilis 3/211]|uniref:Uncharacterized protein n=2 Tax=Nitrospinaceae TaxID=407032 RepID=M1YWJ4_NITG3|nr:hypothetical protein NITGR_170120 [Nitrospina gracilis 3/211]